MSNCVDLRGQNGETLSTLNDRFVKCPKCNVNNVKADVKVSRKCVVCQTPLNVSKEATVHFQSSDSKQRKKPKRRWVEIETKKGKIYYHNSETGEDTWQKPPDFDAEVVDSNFVPFRNDEVKNALLHAHNVRDAQRIGIRENLPQKEKKETSLDLLSKLDCL